jgi:hypothetical protein
MTLSDNASIIGIYASDGTGTFRRQFLKVPVPSDAQILTHKSNANPHRGWIMSSG